LVGISTCDFRNDRDRRKSYRHNIFSISTRVRAAHWTPPPPPTAKYAKAQTHRNLNCSSVLQRSWVYPYMYICCLHTCSLMENAARFLEKLQANEEFIQLRNQDRHGGNRLNPSGNPSSQSVYAHAYLRNEYGYPGHPSNRPPRNPNVHLFYVHADLPHKYWYPGSFCLWFRDEYNDSAIGSSSICSYLDLSG